MSARLAMGLLVLGLVAGEVRAVEGGADLYRSGDSRVLVQVVGGLVLPSTRFPCVHCHGADGRGGREGGLNVPPIDGRSLRGFKPPYDAERFLRALRDGVAPDGRRLHRAMPRYGITAEQAEALWNWLQQAGDGEAPGVSPDRLVLALALPEEGALAGPAGQVRGLVRRVVERWNASGGFWGRRVVLVDEADTGTGEPPLARILRVAPASAVSAAIPDLLALRGDRTGSSVLPLLPNAMTLRVLLRQRKAALEARGSQRVYVVEDFDGLRKLIEQRTRHPGLVVLAPLDPLAAHITRVEGLADAGAWTLELVDVHPLLNPDHPVAQRYAADARALGFDPWRAGLARLAYAGLVRLEAALIAAGRRLDGAGLMETLRTSAPRETGLVPASAPGDLDSLRFWRIEYPAGEIRRVDEGGSPGGFTR